jgi:hypothetical protein
MIRKRVAIIYSGQMRSNSLSDAYVNDNIILEATSKYFLNESFGEKYDYDVFFSVDDINVEKAKSYFGEHLKNIHVTERNLLLSPIESSFLNFSEILNKYLSINFQNCRNHDIALYQYYRLHCGYLLSKDYQEKNNIVYDYYVRIRPDIRLMLDINSLFNILETTNKKIIFEHEQLCIFTKEFVEIFDFIKYYGFFNQRISNIHIFDHLKKDEIVYDGDHVMRFCPERQIIEYVNFIINNKKYIFEEIFLGITYPSFNLLYRGNYQYGYADYNENEVYVPYHSLRYILNNL